MAAALWAADLFPALLRCYDVTLPCLAHLIDGGSGGGGSATTFRVRHGRLRAAIVRVTFALLDEHLIQPLLAPAALPTGAAADLREALYASLTQAVQLESEWKFAVPAVTLASLCTDLDRGFRIGALLEEIDGGRDVRIDFLLASLPGTRDRPLNGGAASSGDGPSGSRAEAEADASVDPVRRSLIAAVKDLLPDLGDGFVDACLREYNDDVEAVLHHVLDGSLPASLDRLDRALALPPTPVRGKAGKARMTEPDTEARAPTRAPAAPAAPALVQRPVERR